MINLIVAHAGEAKPLVRHFKLRRRHDLSAFVVYTGDELQLVQTGAGKLAAAAATGFAAGCLQTATAAWLNVGIAGHRVRDIGEALIAHRVIDAETRDTWYPPILWEAPCPTDALITCSSPHTDYSAGGVVDMEASGFMAAATRAAPSELVHCLKVISDNALEPAGSDTRASGPALIAAQLPAIATLIERLRELVAALAGRRAEPPGCDELAAQFHFSATERQRLKRYLMRLAVLLPDEDASRQNLARCRTGREVLHRLEALLKDVSGRALP